ncbi:hypothetical protein E6C50_06825 [Flavobacterium supellecticarium]|uniref:DUF1080 domain-containing protein n=1 Tax=Flavobacterium supellecticarium TaxID=2565924 RepID=A0A4V3W8J2_9FLAO|nr:hypothetical protein [Flavobacterium supellecticarium]THF51470.1 hypothetical protein E6C50_06825 [Flavobacterium supellecticarium]
MKQFMLWLLLLGGVSGPKSDFKNVFQEEFTNVRLKQWNQVNGNWEVDRNEKLVKGSKNNDWAILTAKKELPDNYILTFSTLVEPSAYLFEVMLNIQNEKYLGILYNQLEGKVAIEDRSFFVNPEKERGYIRTTGHIGKLPKVKIPMSEQWLDWKIQKTGTTFFVWIDNEEILKFTEPAEMIKSNGKFGFAINGSAQLKNIKVYKTRNKGALPPEGFIGKPHEQPFFQFSE